MKQGILLVLLTVPGLSLPGVAVAKGAKPTGTCWYINGHKNEAKSELNSPFECIKQGDSYQWREGKNSYRAANATEIEALGKLYPTEFAAFKEQTSFTTSQDLAALKADVERKKLEAEKQKLEEDQIKADAEKDRLAEEANSKKICEDAKGTYANGKCSFSEDAIKGEYSKKFHAEDHDKINTASQDLTKVQGQLKNDIKSEETRLAGMAAVKKEGGKKEYNDLMDRRESLRNSIGQDKRTASEIEGENITLKEERQSLIDNGTVDPNVIDNISKKIISNQTMIENKTELAQINQKTGLKEGDQSLSYRDRKRESGDNLDKMNSKISEKEKNRDKAIQDLANKEAIKEAHSGSFDGAFGTLHSFVSNGISNIMKGYSGVRDQMGAANVQNAGTQQAASIAAQGLLTDNKKLQEAENKVREEARQELKKQQNRTLTTAILQGALGASHLRSNRVVGASARQARSELQVEIDQQNLIIDGKGYNEQGVIVDVPYSKLQTEKARQRVSTLEKQLANVNNNENQTKAMQFQNAGVMALQMKDSLLAAGVARAQRKAIKDMDYAGSVSNQNYNIQLTNEAPPPGAVDTAPTVTALTDGQILNPETDDKAVALEDQPQFNPTDLDTMAGAPPAPGFGEGRTETPQGAPGGGGGGVGGTQAAQDDGGPQAPAKTKDPVVSYAANDPTAAGRGFSGKSGGGSEGVGIDQAFADLLKKLLPAEEGAESRDAGADQVALGDRAPASDQAAVIGRNQNIFEVIHKRYLKKSQEGAVLYNL